MILSELMRELRAIVKVHPAAKEAQIYVDCKLDDEWLQYINYVKFDTKHKPARIIFET